jgi:hypothetical protein
MNIASLPQARISNSGFTSSFIIGYSVFDILFQLWVPDSYRDMGI